MHLKVLCGLVAVVAVNSTFAAALIDERASAAGAPVTAKMATRGTLSGDFALKEWDQPAPSAPAQGSSLSLAIIRIIPGNMPAVEIDAPPNIVDMPVQWPAGVSRRQALIEIAQTNAINIKFDGRYITITPVQQTTVVMAGAGPVVRPAAPVVVAAPAGKSFEVKLTDIKLSTSMNRWATENGVRIRWDADKHVLVGAPMVFNAGSVFDAVTQALSTPGIKNSDYPLEVCEYPNTPPLLRVTRQGEQTKDCPNS